MRISYNVKETKISVRKDVFAKPQIVIEIEAKTRKDFIEALKNNGFEIYNSRFIK